MDYIYLSDAICARNREYLKANGIRQRITVAPIDEFAIDDDIATHRIPIRDDGMHPLKPYLVEACRVIRETIARKDGVLIHCIEGRAYLLQEKRLNLKQAFTMVKERYPNAQPRYQLFDELLQLERDIFGAGNTLAHSDNYEPIVLGPPASPP